MSNTPDTLKKKLVAAAGENTLALVLQNKREMGVKYYAHTAVGENGKPLPESSGRWQLLTTHLSNVAELAGQFATPFNLTNEARLAGLLHDLGKYRDEFQAYLRGERSSSVETQHAIYGAAWAAEDQRSLLASALAVAGHHAGLHDCGELAGIFAKPSLRVDQTVPKLIQRLESELGPLPPLPQPPLWVKSELAAEFYTRLIFSCLVDGDRLDTALWPETPPAGRGTD